MVRVDATVCTIRAAAGLGSLLNDDIFDEEVLKFKVFGVGV